MENIDDRVTSKVAAGARLRMIRKRLGLRQQDLADFCKLTQGFIADVERGKSGPGADVLAGIERLGYSGNWLLTGEGAMQLASAPDDQPAAAVPVIQSLLFRPPETVPAGNVVRPFPGLIGGSRLIFGLIARVIEAATIGRGVLFVGEPGTGAELAANGLNEYSLRAGKPFVALDCPNDRPNAGRVEAAAVSAHSGTLFLYEITELSAAAQKYLAEILPAHDLRLVGTTSRADARATGRINPVLSERMPITIDTPALGDRREDVQLVADHLLRTYRRTLKRPGLEFELDAWQQLLAEDFSAGNFRQLDWVVEACVAQERSRMISQTTLNRVLAAASGESYTRLYGGTFHATERTLIQDALINYAGERERAARALGIDKFFLLFLMFLLGIPQPTSSHPQSRDRRSGKGLILSETDS